MRLARVVLVGAAVAWPATVRGDERLCARAFDGFKSLIESIDTLECNVEVTTTRGGQSAKSTFWYLKKGDAEKVAPKPGDHIAGLSRRGAAIKTLSRRADPTGKVGLFGVVRAYHGEQELTAHDPWSALTFREFEFTARRLDRRPAGRRYEGFKAAGGALGGAGREGLVVEEVLKPVAFTSEFDAGYNYLRTRYSVRVADERPTASDIRLRKVREVAPGIYLPEEVENVVTEVTTGRVKAVDLVRLTNLKVNHKVDDAAVVLKFPKGTTVWDEIKPGQYETDEAGNPAGPVRPLPKPVNPGPAKP